ncbi:hypothetical protein Dxin01_00949 [Deinococcus xinjiangensis]|uniref:Signal transduction histidine kinase subgroup 3 dimerisation and phosphoacceptor domain-containing protein n=1 Tax=Deinococcus xinjiangensis TaxID=457454 RepID=A0ABP9VC03_9DEIO
MTVVQPDPKPVSLWRFPFRFRRSQPLLGDPLGDLQKSMRSFGLFAWLFMCLHAYLTPFSHIDLLPDKEAPWCLAVGLFALCFLLSTFCRSTVSGRRKMLLLSAVAAGCALLANNLINGNSVLAGLLIIVTLQVGTVLPMRWAMLWVLAQTGVLLNVFLRCWENTDAWAYASGYLFFQLFALVTAETSVREIRARQKLASVVEELRATRALLSEASRQAERLEISRELHDVVGHHLTALSMNLQVASHLTPPSPAKLYGSPALCVVRQLEAHTQVCQPSQMPTAWQDFNSPLFTRRQNDWKSLLKRMNTLPPVRNADRSASGYTAITGDIHKICPAVKKLSRSIFEYAAFSASIHAAPSTLFQRSAVTSPHFHVERLGLAPCLRSWDSEWVRNGQH